MKKIAIILMLLSGSALAGWKTVAEDNAGTTYADTDSIVRNGKLATMSSLYDHKAFQRMVEVGYYSHKSYIEYDCSERRFRGLSLSLLADPMGEGKEIYGDDSPQQWEAVAADSIAEKLLAIACK